jgi:predicted DNA-binding transcriptional regulator YafY
MKTSRMHRLLKSITLLRSGRLFDADTLATELRVSRRTLFRDLRLLEDVGVPCRFEHRDKTYSISGSMFLPALHLSLEEALALLLVTRKFLSPQVHPMYQQAVGAALKIESVLPGLVLQHCGNWLSGLSLRWPPSSSVDVVSGLFQTIQRALADQTRIEARYDSVYDGGEIDVVLDPLRLVFMPRGWYLLAHSHLHGEVRTFKVDRMVEVRATDEHFEPDPSFSERAYFGKAWSMIPEGRIYHVKLRFCSDVATTIKDVRWHETQVTQRLEDGGLLFEVDVDGLGEITAWILSYGEQVEVLEPSELRQRIRERAEKVVELANADHDGRVS